MTLTAVDEQTKLMKNRLRDVLGLRVRRAAARGVAACTIAALLSGCYTTANVVTITPLKTKYPVSASGQYVERDGNIVKETEYEVVHSFEFDKQIPAPRHEERETTLQLEGDLDQLLQQHQGDAVTDVTISASEYETGSHGSAAGWKILGWSFGITGATFAVVGAAVDDEGTGTSDTFITVGGVFVALGVLSYLASAAANDPAVWQLHVEGSVVKRRGGPPSPAPLEDKQDNETEASDAADGAAYLVPRLRNLGWVVPAPGYRPVRVSSAE